MSAQGKQGLEDGRNLFAFCAHVEAYLPHPFPKGAAVKQVSVIHDKENKRRHNWISFYQGDKLADRGAS
ncbi:Hypothetical predicted protein [Cloeon dipterum]|uniref:Uncharacterized protein n=1 Tax=Cloeon dipterum TaxID=197152 RepID=A0A8S1DBQ3_9INSE|nr:Hypothetical predicted protein [Cloeon dipterum]